MVTGHMEPGPVACQAYTFGIRDVRFQISPHCPKYRVLAYSPSIIEPGANDGRLTVRIPIPCPMFRAGWGTSAAVSGRPGQVESVAWSVHARRPVP